MSFIIRIWKNEDRESLFVTRSIRVMTNNVSEGPDFFSHLPMLKKLILEIIDCEVNLSHITGLVSNTR